MGKPFFWNELTSPEFALLDPDTTVAVLPIASTEQHGPHLPEMPLAPAYDWVHVLSSPSIGAVEAALG